MKEFPVKIYAADVRQLEDENLYAAAYRKVTKERREKTDRIRSGRDKRLSLGAELLLMYGLSRLGIFKDGQEPENILRYRYGENGKPYLDGMGMEDIYFNLSHSGETAVCAIAPCEVGCDVERIRDRGMAVARRFFDAEEYKRIVSLEEEKERQEMFCRFWTLKESFLKVTGQGMRLGMDCFRIILGEEKISVVQDVDQRTYYFREYEIGEGLCCAACAVRDEFEPQVCRTDLRRIVGRGCYSSHVRCSAR